jgi:hypothetical protein
LIENEILTKCNINYKNIISIFDEYLDEYYRSFAIDSSDIYLHQIVPCYTIIYERLNNKYQHFLSKSFYSTKFIRLTNHLVIFGCFLHSCRSKNFPVLQQISRTKTIVEFSEFQKMGLGVYFVNWMKRRKKDVSGHF